MTVNSLAPVPSDFEICTVIESDAELYVKTDIRVSPGIALRGALIGGSPPALEAKLRTKLNKIPTFEMPHEDFSFYLSLVG